MTGKREAGSEFREGDEVVLAEGTYQGTPGVFVRFRQDIRWADIKERNGAVRSHPVAWLGRPQDDQMKPHMTVAATPASVARRSVG